MADGNYTVAASDATVKVRMNVSERVMYSTIVEMPLSKFREIDRNLSTLRGRDRADYEERIADLHIDRLTDFSDAHSLEIEDFDLEAKE